MPLRNASGTASAIPAAEIASRDHPKAAYGLAKRSSRITGCCLVNRHIVRPSPGFVRHWHRASTVCIEQYSPCLASEALSKVSVEGRLFARRDTSAF